MTDINTHIDDCRARIDQLLAAIDGADGDTEAELEQLAAAKAELKVLLDTAAQR